MSFFDKAIIAMIGGKIGTVAAFNREDDVPLYERYFLGGSDSIRGFEYRTVSPVVNQRNIGGQTMLLLTAEVTHPIWGPIRGAVFADAGQRVAQLLQHGGSANECRRWLRIADQTAGRQRADQAGPCLSGGQQSGT